MFVVSAQVGFRILLPLGDVSDVKEKSKLRKFLTLELNQEELYVEKSIGKNFVFFMFGLFARLFWTSSWSSFRSDICFSIMG